MSVEQTTFPDPHTGEPVRVTKRLFDKLYSQYGAKKKARRRKDETDGED